MEQSEIINLIDELEREVARNRQIKHRIELCPVNVRKYKQKRSVRL